MKVGLKVSKKMVDGLFVTIDLGFEEPLVNGVTKSVFYEKAFNFLSREVDKQFSSMEE